MNTENLEKVIREKEGVMSLAFPSLMRKVYIWMFWALTITGVTAYGVANSPVLATSIFSNQTLFWALIIGELALVFGISRWLDKLSLTAATLLFILYSFINGITLSVIFFVYSPMVIAKVFFITAGTFGIMAAYGYFTKTDLSKIGKILFMALIGLIIATLVNLFMRSAVFDMVLSYIGVLVFVGLTAWDSQKIKRMLAMQPEADENAMKLALIGALNLYLDFINLFLYLLRIFGRSNN